MIKVRLNKKNKKVAKGTPIKELVKNKDVIAALVNGELQDLAAEITEECRIELLDFSSEQGKKIYWHSASHIMAMAVKTLFPDAKLAIGPAIDQGFYYDFETKTPFSPEILGEIEKKMAEIIKQDIPFERIIMKKEAILEFFNRRNESYKVELVKEIEDEEISLYRNGDFVDLCRGPHVPSTGYIRAFKLLSIAGAYWRGDVNQPMLSRIYGIAFPSREELNDFLNKLEEAKKRDHRKLGAELELFSIFEQAGAGLIYWHPKGAVVKRVIEDYWINEHIAAGYQLVSTPHIARGHLWHQSGHYDYYRENMFVLPVDKEEYILKPMNCPGHILIYKSKLRSYKELPIKFAELGQVYRNELSGTLHGLLRVRGITIDDAHIFCQPEQIEDELVKVLELSLKILRKFGFEKFDVELSVRDPKSKKKYLGTDKEWERAENGLISALKRVGIPYKKQEGEAVFYGPKIDIKLLDALGRRWQATTIQFDFNLPKRFHIEYMDKDGQHKEVVAIHRAIYGSLERFMGCLIEHYKGAFPLWLAPIQVSVMPITNKQNKYAEKIYKKCERRKLRVELNEKSDKINYRIREAELQKIPYILVVGKKEVENNTISVRKRGEGNLGEMNLKEFFNLIKKEIGGAN
ncbi:MAG TPA: threonine--tRNA ligase [candidate division WOR-3 bacterium]|uniref:Threonine--tRNA ligase n=1 Tax=candidate division WOR-3 bacterium TaxID=2052148 RepID=A0A9C9ENT2_UNCW3|nr:threonine--tRNA ligase [candidate division WOR-3 bacterium]